MEGISDLNAKDWQSVCLNKYLELLDYFVKKSKRLSRHCQGI